MINYWIASLRASFPYYWWFLPVAILLFNIACICALGRFIFLSTIIWIFTMFASLVLIVFVAGAPAACRCCFQAMLRSLFRFHRSSGSRSARRCTFFRAAAGAQTYPAGELPRRWSPPFLPGVPELLRRLPLFLRQHQPHCSCSHCSMAAMGQGLSIPTNCLPSRQRQSDKVIATKIPFSHCCCRFWSSWVNLFCWIPSRFFQTLASSHAWLAPFSG